jgi:hypothetical protein
MAVGSESLEDLAIYADVELDLLRGLRGDGSYHGLPIASGLFLTFYRTNKIVSMCSIRSN